MICLLLIAIIAGVIYVYLLDETQKAAIYAFKPFELFEEFTNFTNSTNYDEEDKMHCDI